MKTLQDFETMFSVNDSGVLYSRKLERYLSSYEKTEMIHEFNSLRDEFTKMILKLKHPCHLCLEQKWIINKNGATPICPENCERKAQYDKIIEDMRELVFSSFRRKYDPDYKQKAIDLDLFKNRLWVENKPQNVVFSEANVPEVWGPGPVQSFLPIQAEINKE